MASPPSSPVRGFDPATSVESPTGRSAYQRTYDNADGTQTTEISASPVNYQRADGSWAPIDDGLVPVPGGWRTAADPVAVRVSDRADDPELVRFAVDADHTVAFGLSGAAGVSGQVDGTTVRYPGARPNTDVELQAQSGAVKETLVLASAETPREFVFPLRLTGLSARVVDGEVRLTDETGRLRAVIPAGYMADSAAEPAVSTGVTYELVSVDGRPALRVALDAAWLADPARVFPVRVDPSVVGSTATSAMTVHGNGSSSGASDLLVGNQGGAPAAAYLKFDSLVSSLRFHTIYSAHLQVVNYDSASCRPRPVSVHPVTASWTAGTGYSYPGPAVGAALAGSSFAHGHIATGQIESACPAAAELVDLGATGKSLVQRWVNGQQANNGLSVRASDTDTLGWKRFTGTATANPPRLYVTHSPYNASYSIPKPVPDPPVLQNQAGKVNVTVTNLSAETWQPGAYYLAYRAYDAATGRPVIQQRAANLTASVARNARVTLAATIQPLPPGTYFLDFTMVKTGGVVFTDEQVPPGRLVLQVVDIPPVVQELHPPNGYQTPTLTPRLWARAVDIDAPPGSALRFKFEVCEQNAAGDPVNCFDSGYLTSTAWTVPAGRLSWSKTYQWRAFVKDATSEVPSPRSTILTAVPQPDITSHLAAAPYGSQDKEFDPLVGNFSTAAVDAPIATVGPELSVIRTYNSLDPRRDSAFGTGWITRYDMRVLTDNDGSGNVVVTYADGQQVRFGKNPDGTFAPPPGRDAGLTADGTGWRLADKDRTTYQFSASGRLTRITDAAGRSIVLTHNLTDGKLSRATVSNSQTNTAGRSLSFTWTGSHITSVRTDPVNGTALTWTYTYTGDLLTKVCAPDGSCTTYQYAAGSHYRSAVLDARPESYWRFGEAAGQSAGSEVAVNLGKDAGTYRTVTLGTAGPLAGTTNTAATFNGTSSTVDMPKGTVKKARDAAVELWFKPTATGTGGPLLGYQDKELGADSTAGVPLLYVGTDGKLRGQFGTGTVAPITSPASVNDGRWHHAVLTAMGTTVTLYLDGTAVGTLTNQNIDASTLTFNQIGAAYATTPSSWPAWGSAPRRFFNGAIDEVAVYAHPLGPGAVATHYAQAAAAQALTSVTLPSGKIAAAVEYNTTLDRVAEYTDQNGGTWTVGATTVYGGATDLRRSVEVRDPANRFNLYEYDALTGQLLRSGVPAGLGTRPEDRPGAPDTEPDPPPDETCTQPDPGDPRFCTIIPGETGGPVFVSHPADGIAIRTYAYDDNGFLATITNENGDAVSLTYDDRGNPTSSRTCRTKTECHTAYYTYPATVTDPFDPRNDLPTQSRDGRSAGPADNTYRTTYTYNAAGDLLVQTNPDNSQVKNTYTNGTEAATGGGNVPPGLALTTTDARGAVTRYAYYANGDLAQVTEPSGLVTRFGYDAIGRKTSETEVSDSFPDGVTTTYEYDRLSRPLTTTGPATTDAVTGDRHQQKTTTGYDADGNVVRTEVADLLGSAPTRVSTFEYDEYNQVRRAVDAEGGETAHAYDRFGNLTSTVDVNGNRYDFAYTARNALAEIRLRDYEPQAAGEPDPGDYLVLHSYSYDLAGRMASDTDAMGRRLEYTYYGDDLLSAITLKGFHDPGGTTRDYVVESDAYDGAGNLTRQVTDNGGTVTEQRFNAAGQVTTSVADPGGLARTTAYAYDNGGNVTRITRSGNSSAVPWPVAGTPEVVEYAYDLAGNKTRETVAGPNGGSVTTYGYDQRGLQTSVTNPNGNVPGATDAVRAAHTTTFGYDELARQVRATGPAVATESDGRASHTATPTQLTGYDAFDQQTAVKDPRGEVTRFGYDRLGRAVSTTAPAYTQPAGGATLTPTARTRYDALGNVVEQTDSRGNATRYTYDRLNRVVTTDTPGATNDERSVSHHTYTRTGQPLSATDALGGRVETTYDDLDRPVTVTQLERQPAAAFTTRIDYDDAGNMTRQTTPTGASTTNVHDALGQLTRTTDPSGVVTQYGYDLAGRQVRETDGAGRTTRTDHDVLGRVAAVSDLKPTGETLRTLTNTYDAAGNLLAATNALNTTTSYEYDNLDRLVKQVEPVSATHSITTTFGYDENGNRTRYTDGRGNARTYTYNSLGLPEKAIEPATAAHPDPADRTWTISYDAAGNPVRTTAPGGVTRTRTFDAAGRLTAETGAGAEAVTTDRSLGYDLLGRLTSAGTPEGTDTYAYNDRGLLLASGGPSGEANFGYDADGRLTSRTDAAGTATFGYVRGRLTTATDGLTGTSEQFGYDAAGDLATITYGGGLTRTFGYDDLDRVSSDVMRTASGQTVSSITYGYDLDDRLTAKTTAGTAGAAANTYTYDKAGRLTSWTAGGATVPYEWDDAGNRTRAGPKTATYDERNRLLSDSDYTYAYSPRGTLATRTSSGLTERYAFDSFDRLLGQGSHAYSYDSLDRLISRDGTDFAYAGQSGEVVSDGVERYARGPGDELLAISRGADKRLALSDQHGDVLATIDPTAPENLAGTVAYDPFGQVIAAGGDHHDLGFQGDYTDPDTGSVDMGARWYDPGTGTFASRDAVTYDTGDSVLANGYGYGAADPMDHVDPDGNWPCLTLACLARAAAVGAVKAIPIVNRARATVSRWLNQALSFGKRVVHFVSDTANAVVGCLKSSGLRSCVRAGRDKVADLARRYMPQVYDFLNDLKHNTLTWADDKLENSPVGNQYRKAKAVAKELAKRSRPLARKIAKAARNAVAYAAKHNPIPAIKAKATALKSGLKRVVSATAHLPAQIVAGARDVVADTKRSAQNLYRKAVDLTGVVVAAVSVAVAAAEVAATVIPIVTTGVSTATAIGFNGARLPKTTPDAPPRAEPRAPRANRGPRQCGDNSFAEDTPVLMADGTTKPISEVHTGDVVLATDPTTGRTEPRRVTDVIIGDGEKHLVEITVTTDAGTDKIVATDGHPFWVESLRRWVNAGDLKPGYTFETADHRPATVTSVRTWTEVRRVYNLTVDGLHTYYVAAGADEVLVHNAGNCDEFESLEDYADSLRPGATAQRGPQVAAEYTSPSGNVYRGYNKHGMSPQQGGPLEKALQATRHHRGCAEVMCLIRAEQKEGPQAVYGGFMRAIRVRGIQSQGSAHGTPIQPCIGNCTPLMSYLVIAH